MRRWIRHCPEHVDVSLWNLDFFSSLIKRNTGYAHIFMFYLVKYIWFECTMRDTLYRSLPSGQRKIIL